MKRKAWIVAIGLLIPAVLYASVSVTVNGTSYTIPQTNEKGWGNNVTSWIQAVSSNSLWQTGGPFTLSADVDFGGSFGLESLYYKSRSANIAASGNFRLANTDTFCFRNAGNAGDLCLTPNATDGLLNYNGIAQVNLSASQTLTNKTISGSSNTITNLNASNLTSGSVATSRGGTGIDTSASTGYPSVSAGTWSINTASTDFSNLYKSVATTLGDLIYGGASGAPTRLAGSTSASMAVLTQTGNGAVSAAPVWTSTTGSGSVALASGPTLSSVSLSNSVTPLSILGDPTNVVQFQLGTTNKDSSIGTERSTGIPFIAYNAQYASQADSWQQNTAAAASALLDIGNASNPANRGGLTLYNAASSTATGNKATFWGSSIFSIDGSGNMAVSGTSTLNGIVSATANGTNLFGNSSLETPLLAYRDANAGDSTNLVQVLVGNSGADQGYAALQYKNDVAATGTPRAILTFQPRNTANTTSINPANILMTKTSGADTASIQLAAGGGTLTLNNLGNVVASGSAQIQSLSVAGPVKTDASGNLTSEAQLAASRGGTGVDTSASTGVPQLSAGTWSVSNTLPSAVQGNITTTGTIGTGTWHGTKIGLAYGGTNADLSATGGTSQVLKQTSVGGNVTVGQLAASDLSNGTTGSGSVALATSPILATVSLSESVTPLTFSGDPTDAIQMQLGSSSIYSSIGAERSTGVPFIAYNAKYASQADSWQQNSGTNASALLDIGNATLPSSRGGLTLYNAASGTGTNTKSLFWGTPIFSVDGSGNTTATGLVTASGGVKISNLLVSQTAPTISSGFGTTPSIASNNGTAAFTVNVGTGGTATNGVIGLPTATTGWNCFCNDITTQSSTVFVCKQTASSVNSATIANYNTSGAQAAWVGSDIVRVSCFAY